MNQQLHLALLASVLLYACGGTSMVRDGGQSTDAGPSLDAPAADAPSPVPPAPVISGAMGEYEVPIDGDLAPYARYQVTDVHWFPDPDRGRMILEYTLPAEMIGTAHFVDLDGTDGDTTPPIAIAGDAGSGICEQSGRIMTCTEMLPGVPVDLAAISAAEAAGALSPERAAVSRHFGTDPIGILRFEVP